MNPDRVYVNLLRQYGATWRVRRAEDRIVCIQGKYASIQPYCASSGLTLIAACTFASARQMTLRLKLIAQAGIKIQILQQGDSECSFTFAASDLPRLQQPLKLCRRRADYKPRPAELQRMEGTL